MIKQLFRGRLAAPAVCVTFAASLSLALLPLAASANSGSITASETCQAWSAQAQLDNNVTSDHHVDVVVSPTLVALGHPGFLGKSFTTTGATGPTVIWGPFSGAAPLTATITLTIHQPDGTVEATQTQTIQPPANCVKSSPTITTTLSTGSITVPGSVHDSSALSGATAGAAGTVRYAVYTDNACSLGARNAGTKSVTNGKVPDSDAIVFGIAGTYSWQATYSGDANNTGAVSGCGTETLVANPAPSQTLTGHIYDCSTAASTTEVTGGMIGANSTSGPTTVAAMSNPISASVPAGSYLETATAPGSYHFVACGGSATVVSPTGATVPVTVPTGGNGNGIFYVAVNPTTGTLAGHIYDCTGGVLGTTDVPGGTISAIGAPGSSGLTPVPSQANPLAPTTVKAGDYTATATAPVDEHFTACGAQPASDTRTVTVPAGGSTQVIYYVTHDTGSLGGHIYDCSAGPSTSDLGGTMGSTGPTNVPDQGSPLALVTVQTGTYSVTAKAPSGYTLAACNGVAAGGTQAVTVTANTPANVVFYATKNATATIPASTPPAGSGNLGADFNANPGASVNANANLGAKANGNLGANGLNGAGTLGANGATQPVTGRADQPRSGFLALLLVLLGAIVLRGSRRPGVVSH